MKKYFLIIFLFLLLFGSCSLNPRSDPGIRLLFDNDWLFHRGDIAGGEKIKANESDRRKIDLPYDWSIENTHGTLSPFDSTVVNGAINPVAEQKIEFEITGAGKLAAVTSANPTSTESFQLPQRMTWRGQCMVIVQTGKEKEDIYITAYTEGLPDKN
jgi:hypothetical protein